MKIELFDPIGHPIENISPVPGLLQRKGMDHDPIKPGMFATVGLTGEMEVVSYPVPANGYNPVIDKDATIVVKPINELGDPIEVPLKIVYVYDPSRNPDPEPLGQPSPPLTGDIFQQTFNRNARDLAKAIQWLMDNRNYDFGEDIPDQVKGILNSQ